MRAADKTRGTKYIPRLSVRFAIRRVWTAAGSVSATPLWGRARLAKSGVALRLPPQSKETIRAI
jgi:hypothetical protein